MSSAGRLFSGEVEGVSSGAFGIISCASATAWGCQRNWTHLQTLNHSFETLLLLLVISMTSFCVESPFQLLLPFITAIPVMVVVRLVAVTAAGGGGGNRH